MHVPITIIIVVIIISMISADDVHECQSDPLLKVAFEVFNIMRHGLTNDRFFFCTCIYPLFLFVFILSKDPIFYASRIFSATTFYLIYMQ